MTEETYCILPLAEEHLEEVAHLESLCFSEPWSVASLRFLLSEAACGVVALSPAGRVLGYGGMVIAPDEGQITNVAVHPDSRRMGVGRAVTEALAAEAHRRSLPSVSLEVRASNLPAVALYESLGYAVAGKRRNFYRHPTEDALVMICPLNP